MLFGKLRSSFYYGRGLSRFHSARHKEALRLFDKANELDPLQSENPYYNSLRGRTLLALHEYQGAVLALTRARDLFTLQRPSADAQELAVTMSALEEALQSMKAANRP